MRDMVLTTTGLSKIYPDSHALDGVSMTVRKGDIYGLIGQNGAGKTTLLRLVASLVAPTAGEIALFSRSDLEGLTEGRRRTGCMIEGPAFYPRLSARDNLEYYRIQRGIPDRGVVDRALEAVRLTDTGKKKYQAFSLGMKQRLGLALAIMGKPDLLLLDEPINGLDPTGIIEFRTILKDLQQSHGMTVLVSSHILPELSQVATTFGIIHQGRLVKEFSREQLEGETRRCIALRVADSAAAAAALHETLGTDNFDVLPGGELRLYDYLDNPSEVILQLSNSGVRVESVTELGTNLEEYFLQTIGETEKGRA